MDNERQETIADIVSEIRAQNLGLPKAKCQLMHAKGGAGKAVEKVFVASRYATQFQTDLFLGV